MALAFFLSGYSVSSLLAAVAKSLMLLRDTHFLLFVIVNSAASFRSRRSVTSMYNTCWVARTEHASGSRKSFAFATRYPFHIFFLFSMLVCFLSCHVGRCFSGFYFSLFLFYSVFTHGVQAGWLIQTSHRLVFFALLIGN